MTVLTWRRCRRPPGITTGMADIAASIRAGDVGWGDLMQTSNFATFRGSCSPNLVLIALWSPRGWGGRPPAGDVDHGRSLLPRSAIEIISGIESLLEVK